MTTDLTVRNDPDHNPNPNPTPLLAGDLPAAKSPADSFHFAYLIYFTLGVGSLLPGNTFITAIDYFAYLYPGASVDRVFSVAYTLSCLAFLTPLVLFAHRTGEGFVRINLGLTLFVACMLAVLALEALYVKGRVGLYGGFDATVVAVALSGLADALVQGGIVGSAGEMPERYVQAVAAGTAASGEGILVFPLGIFYWRNYS